MATLVTTAAVRCPRPYRRVRRDQVRDREHGETGGLVSHRARPVPGAAATLLGGLALARIRRTVRRTIHHS